MCFTVRNLNDEVLSFKVSDNVVFTTSSSSLSPWAIRAVDAMVSWRDGWSSQDTLSGTSVSPKSSKEALAALLVLAGLILNVPLEDVTACLKVSYCAAEIFFPSPSASSSSENALLESMSNAALKLRGDSSRAADSTDEDLESGERDLESPDSLCFLDLLTGVLGGLTGVLACRSASLARLTRELIELCRVWRNLSGDLVLVGDPAGVADLLLSESRSGTVKRCLDSRTDGVVWNTRQFHAALQQRPHRHKIHQCCLIDGLGDGREEKWSTGPVWMETSGPPTGVAAGFSCPAEPSTPAAGRGAGPSKSSGSSKRNWELCDDSTIETSAVLSNSTSVVGPSTVTGPSPVVEPSPVAEPSSVAGPSPVAGPLPIRDLWSGRCLWPCRCALPARHSWSSRRSLPGPHLLSRPLPAAHLLSRPLPRAGTGTAGADSIWICRAGEATTVIVHFSWVLDFGGDSWNSRLTTNVPPVLSELSRRLSRWREEELDGRVSDVFETLPDSARLRELDPPEELGRSRSLSLWSLLWPSRRDDWCLGDSPCLRLRSGVRDLRWPDPWELGRSAAEKLEANLDTLDRDCLEYREANQRLSDIVDSDGGCHSVFGNGSTQETSAVIHLTTTCHVISPPFCSRYAKT